MKKPLRVIALAGATMVAAGLLAGSAAGQTGAGYLAGPGEWGKIELVGQLTPEGVDPDEIADLAVYQASNGRWYAYLALWGSTDCSGPEKGGQTSPDGGVFIIDVTDLSNPV